MLPQWTRRRAKIGIGGMSVLGGRPEVVDVRQNDAIDPKATLSLLSQWRLEPLGSTGGRVLEAT